MSREFSSANKATTCHALWSEQTQVANQTERFENHPSKSNATRGLLSENVRNRYQNKRFQTHKLQTQYLAPQFYFITLTSTLQPIQPQPNMSQPNSVPTSPPNTVQLQASPKDSILNMSAFSREPQHLTRESQDLRALEKLECEFSKRSESAPTPLFTTTISRPLGQFHVNQALKAQNYWDQPKPGEGLQPYGQLGTIVEARPRQELGSVPVPESDSDSDPSLSSVPDSEPESEAESEEESSPEPVLESDSDSSLSSVPDSEPEPESEPESAEDHGTHQSPQAKPPRPSPQAHGQPNQPPHTRSSPPPHRPLNPEAPRFSLNAILSSYETTPSTKRQTQYPNPPLLSLDARIFAESTYKPIRARSHPQQRARHTLPSPYGRSTPTPPPRDDTPQPHHPPRSESNLTPYSAPSHPLLQQYQPSQNPYITDLPPPPPPSTSKLKPFQPLVPILEPPHPVPDPRTSIQIDVDILNQHLRTKFHDREKRAPDKPELVEELERFFLEEDGLYRRIGRGYVRARLEKAGLVVWRGVGGV
jgi:hypothetical protein